AEAARYAQPRPLDQALADLHAAWTTERRCLDRLARAELRRDLLRVLAAREAAETARLADALPALEATCAHAALEAQQAKQPAEASTAAIATETGRLHEQLLAAWDAQRDPAAQAARIVLDGPGLFGLRRAAVVRAGAQLTAWADAWRPYLPSMPSDPRRIAPTAAAADDRPRLVAAFADHTRRHAEVAHPEHPRLLAAADVAQAAHERAHRDLTCARREHQDRLHRDESTGRPYLLTAPLVDAQRDVTVAGQELATARTRIEQLRAEPALLAQPADRLTAERDRWRTRHKLQATRARPAKPPSLGVRPPAPEDIRHLAPRPDPGRGIPR
nr:TrwC relaxase [Actinomycetota bacterium]